MSQSKRMKLKKRLDEGIIMMNERFILTKELNADLIGE